MRKSGQADLPLHYGKVPEWLASRMSLLGGAIAEAIIEEYGKSMFLSKLSDPFWFQSFGCVLGMDWHSSGITTSVMGALKRGLQQRSNELGVYICGGRGKYSRRTPDELISIAEKTGLDGPQLVLNSRMSAKVDNTAIQDGFQLYLHNFILTSEGEWAVVQQGMNTNEKMARRYHWHSAAFSSFLEKPHTSIYGKNQGIILNITDKDATPVKSGMLALTKEHPDNMMREIRKLIMPIRHEVKAEDVNLKRLGSVLAMAYEQAPKDMDSLLLLQGVGPRTIQSLAFVSEIIHGAPARFEDPARFSFAHGGKDGHPFPVPTKVYDESIDILRKALDRSRLGNADKSRAFANLSKVSREIEKDFHPNNQFEELLAKERSESWKHGGRTVKGVEQKPKDEPRQLSLF